MAKEAQSTLQAFANGVAGVRHNRYTLSITDMASSIAVLSVKGSEQLNEPWYYAITFTSADKNIRVSSALGQPASLAFLAPNLLTQVTHISSLDKPAMPRTLYGVVTEFAQLSVNKDEAHYRLVLQPRLALFANDHYSAIYQNQSVVSVVEEVLRRHGFTGVDYRLALKDSYPAREFITQWQESDLAFIQRLLADVGIWLRFESHAEHNCDVLVLSDYEQGFEDVGSLGYTQPSGMADNARDSVWDLQFASKSVARQVKVNDYNYREAPADLHAQINSQPKEVTTAGTDYRYGEHFKRKGDDNIIESGSWYAKIRHQQQISEQIIIHGNANDYHLAPGQRLMISGSPINGISEGIVILATECYGDRSEAYHVKFTAMPYNVLKPYRPAPLPWPQVTGTLPARVTSPDNDTYGYIDTMGRYRVKFDFDLKTWRSGEESLWVRLAKPYAGDRYGFHFPLIDGTEVAIAFTGGNPDRPYIAHAMHDSTHPDPVTTINKHRNVLRTPANNKLRMDDKRGQEHIKLATEYGKSQLNLGHLVNQNREQRGEGFELRTDEWGAISANKGLYLTAQSEPQAQGQQLDMQGAIAQLENALSIAKALQNAANSAQAHPADLDSQQQLQSALKQLTEAGMIAYAPAGIGLTSDENIQLSSGNSISLTSEQQTDISALNNITLTSSEAVGIFAHKAGMKLLANQGQVELQAQNDALDVAAKQEINIDSVDGHITITAKKEIILISGGSYIKIDASGVELGSSGNVTIKASALQKMGPASMSNNIKALSEPVTNNGMKFRFIDENGLPHVNENYIAQLPNGKKIQGVSDSQGYTQTFFSTNSQEQIKLELIES
ncbi:type VI secretion system tip protein VgrG [Orbus sturtevantii]|uniref:type VI secretion system Vgr family protein n=1 Tax=Orbus sturtevantii TaxID=3074109 RepID=UPI00370D3B96